MPDERHPLIVEDNVFELTAKGQNELRGSATSLAPPVLEVLVLIDGRSTVGETAARARTIGNDAVVKILGTLFRDRISKSSATRPVHSILWIFSRPKDRSSLP
jgi:hypothetical protein